MPRLSEIFTNEHYGLADTILDNIVEVHREDELLMKFHQGRCWKTDLAAILRRGIPQVVWAWTTEEEIKLPSQVTEVTWTAQQNVCWDAPVREHRPGEATIASYMEHSKQIIIDNLKSSAPIKPILPPPVSARLHSFDLLAIDPVELGEGSAAVVAYMNVKFNVKVRTLTREKR